MTFSVYHLSCMNIMFLCLFGWAWIKCLKVCANVKKGGSWTWFDFSFSLLTQMGPTQDRHTRAMTLSRSSTGYISVRHSLLKCDFILFLHSIFKAILMWGEKQNTQVGVAEANRLKQALRGSAVPFPFCSMWYFSLYLSQAVWPTEVTGDM